MAIDFEAFRLRSLLNRLVDAGEVEIHDEPVPLVAIAAILEASDKAVLFRRAGPEECEIVGGISGSRRRLALAMSVDPRDLATDFLRRMQQPQSVVQVPGGEAPVQQIQITGDAIDATKLPFHLQHELDGAPYISSAIDFAVDPVSGQRNVGCRRLMLCGRRELRANLTQVSDLRRMYLAAAGRGEHLPVNFAIGSHPADLMASSVRLPLDEFNLIGTLRGSPVPMVRALTNDVPVPADAELVIEGYFDKAGYNQLEGPYGELLGFYGPVHENPAYRITAITMRNDVLHQTVLHGAVRLARTESVQIGTVVLEARIWQALRGAGIGAVAVNGCAATGGMVSARAAVPAGQGRRAVEVMLAVPMLKHVVVTDPDIDVFCDEAVEWAMSTRFQPDRDLVTVADQMAFPMDMSATDRTLTKVGYDLTGAMSVGGIRARVARAPRLTGKPRFTDVRAALAEGPKHFGELMSALGSDDGREIVLGLEELQQSGTLSRIDSGAWTLCNG